MKMATLRFNKGRKSSHMPIISGLSAFKTKNFSLPETCPLFILCWQLYWDYINKTMSLLQCIIWHQTKKERLHRVLLYSFSILCVRCILLMQMWLWLTTLLAWTIWHQISYLHSILCVGHSPLMQVHPRLSWLFHSLKLGASAAHWLSYF